jgi:polyphosphate kinase
MVKKKEGKVAYFNRELSWLAFNRRVLEQAQTPRNPLLERLRYLSFVSSNLDEFFEIRVAGLVQQVDSGVQDLSMDGLGPKEQLRRIHSICSALVQDQYRCWREQLLPELRQANILFKTPSELSKQEMQWVESYFEKEVYPVLTPLGIDPAHPFPQIGNKSLNILVSLDNEESVKQEKQEVRIAIIPIPRILPRVIPIDLGESTSPVYIFLSDILKIFAYRLFPGYKMRSAHAFRLTRNSDLYIDEEEVTNLLLKIEEELHKMRKGAAVRLEIEEGVDNNVMERLLHIVRLPQEYVFQIDGPINLMRLMSVYDLIDRPDLKFKPFQPRTPAVLQDTSNIFTQIHKGDILLHHPFESYQPIVDFIEQAAVDPDVFAIKQTLYRTSGDSPIVKALMKASQKGKQVTALIELKARFDEANNIQWARRLEEVGVHVVYGLVGLKTHCKCCLIVRREPKGLRRYAHLSTGNYNPKTARLYTDLSLFTANERLTSEVADLFNTLTGFARTPDFRKLLVAPFNLHQRFIQLIHKEVALTKAGKPGRIIVKVNSLIDRQIIDELYLASQAGVKVDLIVRGICGLVPGVRGLSENIRVRSILGRYLEHSRIYYFGNGGENPLVYVGSADWMQRNFYRRIETVFPILDKKLKHRIIHEILPVYLADNQLANELLSNGAYQPVAVSNETIPVNCQEWFADDMPADALTSKQQE